MRERIHQRINEIMTTDKVAITLGYLIVSVIPGLFDTFTKGNPFVMDQSTDIFSNTTTTVTASSDFSLLGTIISILAAMLVMAYSIELLNKVRTNEFRIENIFEHFKNHWVKLLVISILVILILMGFMLLVSLLLALAIAAVQNFYIAFIVVFIGIIVSAYISEYIFGLSEFYIVDKPQDGSTQHLSDSARDTKGRRVELFLTAFKYMQWTIYFSIICFIFMIAGNAWAAILLGIGNLLIGIYTGPRIALVFALFYDMITGGQEYDYTQENLY